MHNGNHLGTINPLVDIYNSISLSYEMPCGGEDINTFAGDIRLTKAVGNEDSFKQVDRELEYITSKNIKQIYETIFIRVKEHRKSLQDSIIKCFKVMDDFNIKFNIHCQEDIIDYKSDLKDIEELFFGQMLVAVLSLFSILEHLQKILPLCLLNSQKIIYTTRTYIATW